MLLRALGGFREALTLPISTTPLVPDDDYDPVIDQYNVAIIESALRNNDRAVSAYDAFLQQLPNDHVALYNRANLLWRLGKTAEAENGYRQAIDALPSFAEARDNLAELLIYLKRPDEGIAVALEAMSLPKADRVWAIEGEEQPWATLDALATGYIVKATLLNDDARCLRQAVGALDEAIPLVSQKSLSTRGRTVLATMYLRRGFAHAKLGHKLQARTDLAEAKIFAPSSSIISLAAAQGQSALAIANSSVLRADIAGIIVLTFAVGLLVLVCIQMFNRSIGDAAFATVSVGSLGAMLLGASLPHLTSFKLGVAEASLTTEVVTLTAFEFLPITPPGGEIGRPL
jgi:tetratricopeptide (TPR) repeat protein